MGPMTQPLARRLVARLSSRLLGLLIMSLACSKAEAADKPAGSQLAPFGAERARGIHPAWVLEGLPDPAVPLTAFEWSSEGQPGALRIQTDRSYGLLRHGWHGPHASTISWRWRLDRPLPEADIQTKQGDDAALKLCIMFDQPLQDLPFLQRLALSVARQASNKDLPSATLCYVWDKRYPVDQSGANPYTERVRYIVVDSATSPLQQWLWRTRDVRADFMRLFGSESNQAAPVTAVAVGADSDNTQGQSLGYVQVVRWGPAPQSSKN